jgi:hypothetical protein
LQVQFDPSDRLVGKDDVDNNFYGSMGDVPGALPTEMADHQGQIDIIGRRPEVLKVD